MVKLLTDMSDEELAKVVKKKPRKKPQPVPQEPVEEERDDDEYLPDDDELGESIWHRTTKDRTIFDQVVTKPPRGKKGKLLSALSVDHPSDLPKRVAPRDVRPVTLDDDDPLLEPEPEEEFDINEPGINARPARRKRGSRLESLKGSFRIIAWVIHALFMAICLGFTYYLITIVRAGVVNFEALGTISVIISIQVSLVALNAVIGSVIKR